MDGDSDGQRRRGHVWLIVNENAPADAPPKLFKCEQATKENGWRRVRERTQELDVRTKGHM